MSKEFTAADCSVLPRGWAASFRAERSGDWTRALRLQESANAQEGLSYESCMRIAWLHFQAGGYRRALEYYEIAGLFSEHAEAPLLGALDCCVAMGDLERANQYLDSVSNQAVRASLKF